MSKVNSLVITNYPINEMYTIYGSTGLPETIRVVEEGHSSLDEEHVTVYKKAEPCEKRIRVLEKYIRHLVAEYVPVDELNKVLDEVERLGIEYKAV